MKNARTARLVPCLFLVFSLLFACGDDDNSQTPPPGDRVQCDESCQRESENALNHCVEILVTCGAESQTEDEGTQCIADLETCNQAVLQNMLACAAECDGCLSDYSSCAAGCDGDSSCLETCEGQVYSCNGWDQSCLADCQSAYHTCWDEISTFESIRDCVNALNSCKSTCR